MRLLQLPRPPRVLVPARGRRFLRELPERIDHMTAARRAAARAMITVTAATALGVTLLSAGPPAGALAAAAPAVRSARLGQPAASPIPAPRHRGSLRITGSLRDGGTVRAAGLSWRPGRLPPGDRLLSFEVGYYWDACTAAGKCRTGADTTVAPFAARR